MNSIKFNNWFYSKTYDCYGLFPMKTGTTHLQWILHYYDFVNYTRLKKIDGTFRDFNNSSHAINHECYIPEEVINPKSILSTRNPYFRILSFFLFTRNINNFEDPTPSEFGLFLKNLSELPQKVEHLNYGLNSNFTYLIKQENLYEDLIKIDWIRYSKLNETGILKDICDKKLNESQYQIDKGEYLTEYNKSIIYELFKFHFDKFGYEK